MTVSGFDRLLSGNGYQLQAKKHSPRPLLYLCREERYFRSRSLRNQDNVEQSVTRVRVGRDRQTASGEAAVCDDDVVKIDREPLGEGI